MAHVYTDMSKAGRERYSGPATYGALGEGAVDLAWAQKDEVLVNDELVFTTWWGRVGNRVWWRPWMSEFQTEAHDIYTSALTEMRKR